MTSSNIDITSTGSSPTTTNVNISSGIPVNNKRFNQRSNSSSSTNRPVMNNNRTPKKYTPLNSNNNNNNKPYNNNGKIKHHHHHHGHYNNNSNANTNTNSYVQYNQLVTPQTTPSNPTVIPTSPAAAYVYYTTGANGAPVPVTVTGGAPQQVVLQQPDAGHISTSGGTNTSVDFINSYNAAVQSNTSNMVVPPVTSLNTQTTNNISVPRNSHHLQGGTYDTTANANTNNGYQYNGSNIHRGSNNTTPYNKSKSGITITSKNGSVVDLKNIDKKESSGSATPVMRKVHENNTASTSLSPNNSATSTCNEIKDLSNRDEEVQGEQEKEQEEKEERKDKEELLSEQKVNDNEEKEDDEDEEEDDEEEEEEEEDDETKKATVNDFRAAILRRAAEKKKKKEDEEKKQAAAESAAAESAAAATTTTATTTTATATTTTTTANSVTSNSAVSTDNMASSEKKENETIATSTVEPKEEEQQTIEVSVDSKGDEEIKVSAEPKEESVEIPVEPLGEEAKVPAEFKQTEQEETVPATPKPMSFSEKMKLDKQATAAKSSESSEVTETDQTTAAPASHDCETQTTVDSETKEEEEQEEKKVNEDGAYLYKYYKQLLDNATPISDVFNYPYAEEVTRPKVSAEKDQSKVKYYYDLDFLMQFKDKAKVYPDKEWTAFIKKERLIGLPPTSYYYNVGGNSYGGSGRGGSMRMGRGGRQMSGRGGSGNNTGFGSRSASRRSMGERSGSSRSDSKRKSKRRGNNNSSNRSEYTSRYDSSKSGSINVNSYNNERQLQQQQFEQEFNNNRHFADENHGESAATSGAEAEQPKATNRWKPKSRMKKEVEVKTAPDGTVLLGPEEVEKKMKSLLNKLTLEKFDSISTKISAIANQSKYEEDGTTMKACLRLILDKACDEPHWATMYAKLFGVIVQNANEELKDSEYEQKKGNYLVLHYIFLIIKGEFDKGWIDKLPTKEDGTPLEPEMMSDDYYVMAAAKRKGLGLVRLIGHLYQTNLLGSTVVMSCFRKFLADINGDHPQEETLESLLELLQTVGSKFETAEIGNITGGVLLDLTFDRLQVIINKDLCSSRIKFKLMDLSDLRLEGWVDEKKKNAGPKTISEIHKEEEAKRLREFEERQYSRNSNAGSRRSMRNTSSRYGGNNTSANSNRQGSFRTIGGSSSLSSQKRTAGGNVNSTTGGTSSSNSEQEKQPSNMFDLLGTNE
ncbi:uncharacterized protein SCODWIG_03589 [Saccharomycodes ludwigii]|uniref:MIF4G domain-containing protein n=1 Tax=Saccharomycodes ludwigii TaxID=36035 RepID=A0A376BAX0_9ASCO|nr:hypothetical protein SCDLUD_001554 [Saccharomycodes ludwigii]KAH3901776.1 hypothetical protein SCDLUD_001554 [Saccharomycodes ludwigii]SSD61828.1 uncharacterized protein SCODWIG_03589 [Saccharomycodes ludwigii]